jgi:hypothetical protein
LIGRTRLYHDRVSPLKNMPELSGITVEINNLRGDFSPAPPQPRDGPLTNFNHLVAAFPIPKFSKNKRLLRH